MGGIIMDIKSMKIDYDKLEKKCWFEDQNGNEVSGDDPNAAYYRHCFPLELVEHIDSYCYHPDNPIIRFLCRKSKKFYKWISKGKRKTFKPILASTCSICKQGGETIVAMVNSGDFTLEQAIWVYGKSCERCSNVLTYKYLGTDGYEEYSNEWKKANTECEFCKGTGGNFASPE